MNRRHLLGSLTGGLATLGFASELLAAEEEKGSGHGKPHNVEGMQKCLDACTACMNECNMTTHYCYERTHHGTAKYLDALHLSVDCQEFCGQSAKMIARVSPLSTIACQACAEACEACAAECEKHSGDEQLEKCAKQCRACAESCKSMVAHTGHHAAEREKLPKLR